MPRSRDREAASDAKEDGPNKGSARDRILDAADDLLYTEGLNTVGVDRLIDEAGVAKASLYRIFGSKDRLIDTYLESRHFKTMAVLDEIRESDDTVVAKINSVFDHLGRLTEEEAFRGCAFVLGAIETSDHEHPAWKWAERHKAEVRDFFGEILAPLGDPELVSALMEKMMILYDGTLITIALRPKSRAVFHARAIALMLLEGAMAETASRDGQV